MNTQDKLKQAQAEVEKLKLQLKREENRDKEYGRMALNKDEAKFCIGIDEEIVELGNSDSNITNIKQHPANAFTTISAAERWLKAEKMTVKCKQAMARSWGNTAIDWEDAYQSKYTLRISRGSFGIVHRFTLYNRFTFKTMEDAEKFIDSHSTEDIILMIKGGDV